MVLKKEWNVGVCFLFCLCFGYVKECVKGKKIYFNNILWNMKVIKELKKKRLSKKINICIIVFGECVELRRGGGLWV